MIRDRCAVFPHHVGDVLLPQAEFVRETESLAKKIADGSTPAPAAAPKPVDVHTRAAEERLRLALGTRVRIVRKGKAGRIEIDFGSEEELIRIYEQLTER